MSAPRLLCRPLTAIALALSAGAFSVCQPAAAQATVSGNAVISSGALNGSSGALTVNEAAGLNNAQSNQLLITNGLGYSANTQSASAAARVPSAHASIEGTAFSNISGALMVNQSAGAANAQSNSVVLSAMPMNVAIASDNDLSAVVPQERSLGKPMQARDTREAIISNQAFKNVNGIAQVNQTAGAGNATANSFVLRPPAGTFFN